MFPESAIIERVEMFVRHPVFSGSDRVMESVLDDLHTKASAHEISPDTYIKLRTAILRSPHFCHN